MQIINNIYNKIIENIQIICFNSKVIINKPTGRKKFEIPDSREGWVDSIKELLSSYFIPGLSRIEFDYSKIRPQGIELKTFGGISSGPGPLRSLHGSLSELLDKAEGKRISSRIIVDIMNLIGNCVVAGNIRRTAEIAFGEADDEEFLNLKNYEKYPERAAYGWTSNNSIFAQLGMNYTEAFCKNIRYNGEPGFCWLENMRAYGRMSDPPNHKDSKAAGGNPCLEQTLESFEMCCLVETFPYNHENYEEFEETLRYAFEYCKTVTLGLSHWEQTNAIISRNRRIGCSMSGIAQFVSANGLHTLKEWCERGYKFIQECDQSVSKRFSINKSIKTTCIKPSGTVSLLAGATPGVHFPESQYYIRRIRMSKDNKLYPKLLRAGYRFEEDASTTDSTKVIATIPVCAGKKIRTIKQVTMWEQLELATFMQRYWADNQVSCTVQFDDKTEGPLLPHALEYFQYNLKGISFLPKLDPKQTVYTQLPYEEISEDKYREMLVGMAEFSQDLERREGSQNPIPEMFCENDRCVVNFGASQPRQ